MAYVCPTWGMLGCILPVLERSFNDASPKLIVFETEWVGNYVCTKLVWLQTHVWGLKFYKEANYTHMTLLHVSDQLGVIQMLEAALIAMNRTEKACRNERPGGEGPRYSKNDPISFHFAYVVGARADQKKPIR